MFHFRKKTTEQYAIYAKITRARHDLFVLLLFDHPYTTCMKCM